MGRKNAAEVYIDHPEDAGRHVRTVQTQWGMSCSSRFSCGSIREINLPVETSLGPAEPAS